MMGAPRLALSAATAAALELPQLLALLAERASTDLGRERLLALRPYAEEAALTVRRRRYADAERLLAEGGSLIPAFERPLGPLLGALGSRDGGEGRDLVAIGALLGAVERARARIDAADPPCEALAARVREVPTSTALRREIERRLDGRGEVRDDASPELVRLRGRIHTVRDRLYDQLGALVERHREHLGEDTIPLRGGRLVLVLKAGASGRLEGLNHGRSGTGKSVYFEPLETVEPNNSLQQAIDDEAAERRRILRQLLEQTRAELPAIEAQAELLAALDVLQASVRFAQVAGARLADVAPRYELRLVQARHPLLDPALAELRQAALGTPGHSEPVTPLDLTLAPERRVLVVTGPNAGGKTVVLKTAGLLALAHQCGLPIPAAAGSRLPLLDAVVATVGDEQDLLADRSTFSGRLLRLREAWDAAGPDALVLLDELGSGTDPEEGAALSVALLETLAARGATALVSTHLTRVAAAALDLPGALCAAMEFDPASGEPTFRLLPGPPGGSEALALGRRLGLPAAWLERAEALLGPEHRALHRLLDELEADRRALAEARAALDAERGDVEKLRRRLAERETALGAERERLAATLRAELEAFRKKTRERLDGELERLRRELAAGSQRKARRESLAGAAVGRLFSDAPAIDDEVAAPAGELEIGAAVRHRRLGWRGTLEKLDRGQAQVRVSGKTLRCPADDLALDGAAKAPAGTGRARRPSPAAARAALSAPEVDDQPAELMLIGERVEPALERLDRFLDRALLAGGSEVRVVHGHGSGRLRQAVRGHLHRHPAVAGHRQGGAREGGDGATVVRLRGA